MTETRTVDLYLSKLNQCIERYLFIFDIFHPKLL